MAFLDVSCSLTGRRWIGPSFEEDRLAEAVAREAGVDRAVALTLARRGVGPAEAAAFLDPKLRDLLPDPLRLRDMDRAAARLLAAVRSQERVAVFADYDVDGAASAALLLTWLRALGSEATLYVPDRLEEGYGPNAPAMRALGEAHDLVVCVDCGTAAPEPIAACPAEVIVLDHHLGPETAPACLAVVNPNRADEDGSLGHLCAAGVVFLCLVEANRRLRAEGRQGPDLLGMLDLVALATVADVAPLTGVNRALVRQGLAVMARRERPGLVALADVAGLAAAPSAHSLGYVLGPRLNAGGRVGRADLGARLLSTDDPTEARALAERLHRHNEERRAIEDRVRAEALAQAEARGPGPLAWAAAEGWHPGVVGIVAARLKEATDRPAVVLAIEGDVARGSARSVAGVDIGGAVARLAAEGHALQGGGHRMAAGLTVARDRLGQAMDRLAELLARQGAGSGGPRDLALDGMLMPRAASVALVEGIERAGPFGAAAPSPRWAFPDLAVDHARVVGANHLRLALSDGMGGRLEAIAFGAADGPLAALRPGAGRFHVAGRLEADAWNGRRRVQLRLEDAAPAGRRGASLV
ncbi:single-stranded-DNA-specific exonuclease RecJ [Rubellimicrobium sp. CFH 75288]|uniref:single-stranded-DNA-specific exonuclease RecJ n=1 Tax=Rubellimicrobium sp. CFH 75288 TaxID=2697034 RepID=UPI001412E4DD|nr:single-stranded-DNA-specific exonuclease RecJ [Rubellimicrobium sp. CFH 75288]NAZ36568.1 single-stranded-DNA-specific exonuclease RecJ [Rubellimicrobium sp. CFH 75288]